MLRQKVQHYVGKEITTDVIEKINLMAMKRYDEGVFSILYEGVDTLEDLCSWHGALPEEENVLLGEDWVIVYVKRKCDIELVEWLDVEDVPDKFSQTIEMFEAMKNILLSSEGMYLVADMRHDTSYQFYSKFLEKGFLETYHDDIAVEDAAPTDVERFATKILDEYGSYEKYFSKEGREINPELDKYFYHSVSFGITEKFVKRYKK